MRNTSVLIVGLGKTGVSIARYLNQCDRQFAAYDTRQHPPGLKDIMALDAYCKIYTRPFDANILARYGMIVLSPGVSLQTPAIQFAQSKGVEVIGDIELFARAANKPIIGVTGSNGKSTVVTLVGDMLRAAGRKVGVGGNIGAPALDLLSQEVDIYVLELSSFQLETTESLRCEAAVVLNVSEDHIDRHTDMTHYTQIKQKIYRGCQYPLFNRNDAQTALMQPEQAMTFGLDAPMGDNWGLNAQQWLAKGEYEFLDPAMLHVSGQHNWSNMLAAFALAQSVGASIPQCLAAAYAFTGLPHRMNKVAEFAGHVWINDSKATNVGACAAAVEGLAQPLVLIAGGEGKGADFSVLQAPIKRYVTALVLLGRDAQILHQAIGDAAPVAYVEDMSAAVRKAQEMAQPGDAILLSPACASFDMYTDYAARGNAFCAAVDIVQSETS